MIMLLASIPDYGSTDKKEENIGKNEGETKSKYEKLNFGQFLSVMKKFKK